MRRRPEAPARSPLPPFEKGGTEGGFPRLRRAAVLACLVAVLSTACQPPHPSDPTTPEPTPARTDFRNPQSCVEDFDPAADYFPAKAAPRFAERFAVEYYPHYKLVTVTLPDGRSFRYLLLQCGTPRPAGYGDAEFVQIPVRTVVTTSTAELPHLVTLDLVDRLVGHDDPDYVSSPEVRRRIAAGQVREVGRETRLNLEILLAVDPELVLMSTLGGFESGSDARLRQAGVAVAYVPSYLETTPLGTAEWILFTACFFNREDAAAGPFSEVAERYQELAALGRTARERPTVFTGAPIGDVWHVPGGESFMAHLVEDAGGRYLWDDQPVAGSVPLAIESVYERAENADFWLHPGLWGSLDALAAADERFTALAAFGQRRVYANDARMNEVGVQGVGGNDYWETGIARPDVVLADLLRIFHPELVPGHELVYHRRLDE